MVKVDDGKKLLIEATFAGLDDARAAATALEAAGIDPKRISIAKGGASTARGEAPVMSRVFWTGFWWSVGGAAVGALIGLTLGRLGVGVPGAPDNIAIQVASWAMFLHVGGALCGCYASLDTGDRFARSGEHHDRAVTSLRVRVQHRAELDRATETMIANGGAIAGGDTSATARNGG